MVQARLREVLEPSWTDVWAILTELEAILGRFGRGWGGNRCFYSRFSILFETCMFRIKMVILAGLGAILVPLGAILGASWADLGPTWAPKMGQREPKTKICFSTSYWRLGG